MTMPVRVKSFLKESQIPYSLCLHMPTYTAQEEAAVVHVPGQEVAKTVVLRAGDELYLAVLPASYQINFHKLGDILGLPVRLATEQEFVGLFPDCEAGAMPPFGPLYSLPVLVDESLAEDEEIAFNAGTHTDTVRMGFRDFVRLAQPQIRSFAERNIESAKPRSSFPDFTSSNVRNPAKPEEELTEFMRALEKSSRTPLWELDIVELSGHNIEARGREEVNRMLQQGWKLLYIYTLRYEEDGIWRERPMAILGRTRKEEKKRA